MKDEDIITKMLEIGEKHIKKLNHNQSCHFSIKLAGITIGMALANIDKATPNRRHAKEDMEKFRELVDDEANFYYHQEMNFNRDR